MDLITLINDLNEIDTHDVMLESINLKLSNSLSLYISNLDRSCEDILDTDCLSVVTKIINKYTRKDEISNE